MKYSTIDNCELIRLPKIQDNRGDINIIEGGKNISFDIKRVFYLHNIPKGAERGGHAHKKLHQFIIPISGSFDIVLNDGVKNKIIRMNSLNFGLILPAMIWQELRNFTSGSVCHILASEYYDKNDYIYDFKIYKNCKQQK